MRRLRASGYARGPGHGRRHGRLFVYFSVLADDLVCRVGVPQLFELRDACVDGLCKCKVPKWRALASLAARYPVCDNLLDDENEEASALSEACCQLLKDEAREDLVDAADTVRSWSYCISDVG